MKVTIHRNLNTDIATQGALTIEGLKHLPIFTLEEPWKDNAPKISCIPLGEYKAVPHGWKNDNKFKQKQCWEITDVPGRSGILIHVGNTTRDIEGCILVGLSTGQLNGLPAVLQSKLAMDLLRSFIGQQSFDLTIK